MWEVTERARGRRGMEEGREEEKGGEERGTGRDGVVRGMVGDRGGANLGEW